MRLLPFLRLLRFGQARFDARLARGALLFVEFVIILAVDGRVVGLVVDRLHIAIQFFVVHPDGAVESAENDEEAGEPEKV